MLGQNIHKYLLPAGPDNSEWTVVRCLASLYFCLSHVRLWLPSQLPLLAPSAAALFYIRLLPSKSDLKPLVLTEAPTLGKLPLLEIFLGNCCSSRNQSELGWKCHCSAYIFLESDILCSPNHPPLLLHAHLRCCLEMST